MSGRTQAVDREPLVCPICKKQFANRRSKKIHVLVIHQNAGLYRCSHCSKSFQNRHNFENHERVHTGERPFPCEICKKRFKSKGDKKVHHLDMHAKKKFKCKTCGESFGRPYKLKLHHLQQHQSEKKFKCDHCGKGFLYPSILNKHLRCHSSERFQCDRCDSSFKFKNKLTAHQKSRHSTTQHPETPGQRCLARSKVQEENTMKVLQPNGSGDSSNSTPSQYRLRSRGKPVNYRDEDEVEPDESSESRPAGNSESGGYLQESNVPCEADSTSADVVLDEEENGRTEKRQDMSASPGESRDHVQDDSSIIILSSDDEEEEDESDQDADLAPETSIFSNVSLKLVYDVKYRAPE